MGLIEEAENWMDMLVSRNLSSHTYDSDTAKDFYKKIIHTYIIKFEDFKFKMQAYYSDTQTKLFDKE